MVNWDSSSFLSAHHCRQSVGKWQSLDPAAQNTNGKHFHTPHLTYKLEQLLDFRQAKARRGVHFKHSLPFLSCW